ncbi:hypothetical protein RQP46_003803 [Phenoliferia psychrophenolica]
MATIDSLPNETLCKIMGMLKGTMLHGTDAGFYDSFRAAALVSSRDSLDEIHLFIAPSFEDAMHAALPIVAPLVRTLILDVPSFKFANHTVFEGRQSVFATFTSIEELSGRLDAQNFRAILDALPSPPTLRRLRARVSNPADLEKYIPLILHPALSNLTSIEFSSITPPNDLSSSAPNDDRMISILEMEKACEARGIELILGRL